MRDFRAPIAVLSRLHELSGEAELATAFRQGMASLAQVAQDPGTVPFAGVEPEALLGSVRTVLEARLLDELDFLSPSGAASALDALASALPIGPERRELGRRVLVQLHQGDADSFIALGKALALGATRAFDGPAVRARLALVLLLPARASVCVDPLAFALLSHRELAARFIFEPVSGDLQARRLAARLLERAARHAALRAAHGDDGELAIFEAPPVQAAFAQLLADHEPLVFRHVASARGLLSASVARYAEELERDLMASHSLSRARRGATSLAARVAVRPVEALARARELLAGPALARDPGLAAALIHGLSRALEVEPEAAEQLMLAAVERGGVLAAEALLDLRRELHGDPCCAPAAALARQQLERLVESSGEEPGQLELLTLLQAELEPDGNGPAMRLPEQLSHALLVYARLGPVAALELAREALATAHQYLECLGTLDAGQGKRARAELYRLCYELDAGLLESSALFDLLAAAAPAQELARPSAALTALLIQLLERLIAQEEAPHHGDASVLHLSLRMRRLRTLVHLLDTDFKASEEQAGGLRDAQLAAVRKLCERVAGDASSAMDRIVHAALARGVDALVRSEALELADVLLCLASVVALPEGLLAIADGCLLPDLKRSLRALFALTQALGAAGSNGARTLVSGLSEVAHVIPSDESPRTEALRRALFSLACALEAMLAARSVRELLRSRRALTLFENAVVELAYLSRGARRRLGMTQGGIVIDESPVAGLTRALESAAAQGELSDLAPTLEWLERELVRALPGAFARAISRVLATAAEWPLEGVERLAPELLSPAAAETCPLPAWVPPSRRLSGFFVVRPLGVGLVSSVFLVKRSEERGERSPPGLVLKVPRYDASAARVLSEAAFEQAFARELPALLSVPPHEHLATFVSVETRSLPKPFLVMEWVEGPTLARVRKRKLDPREVLEGVLAGLEALHAVGIGHCDVSPSRVILRLRGGALQPVLADFGLAGRHVRPGCGQALYAAPELWARSTTTPMALDVYAVGCLAYELVTGRPLFHGSSEPKIAQAHAAHDGAPPGVLELAREPRTARLAEWITLCLRGDPQQRATAAELRRELRAI